MSKRQNTPRVRLDVCVCVYCLWSWTTFGARSGNLCISLNIIADAGQNYFTKGYQLWSVWNTVAVLNELCSTDVKPKAAVSPQRAEYNRRKNGIGPAWGTISNKILCFCWSICTWVFLLPGPTFTSYQPSNGWMFWLILNWPDFSEPVPRVASDSRLRLTGVGPDLVFCCCSQSGSSLGIFFCALWCFSAHHGCIEWISVPPYVVVLSAQPPKELPLPGCFLFCFVFHPVLCKL